MPSFAAQTAEYLRAHHAAAAAHLSSASLDAAVARSLARARSYGLTRRSSLVCFAALALEVGPDFDEHPRIRAALGDEASPPDERLAKMLELTTEADWQDARALGVAQGTDPFELTPVSLAHVPALEALLHDLGPASPFPPSGAAAWVERSVRARAEGREFAFVIAMRVGALVGVTSLMSVGGPGRRAALSYWVGRAYQGRGYATAAAGRVAAFGFTRLRLARIDAAVAPDNAASRRVLEKLGALCVSVPDAGDDGRAPVAYLLCEER